MRQRIVMACALTLSLALPAAAQNNRKAPEHSGRPPAAIASLIDPGFESFALTLSPISGWYSADMEYAKDARFADLTMTPDSQVKVEGRYSLRIEQDRSRPLGRGQASLTQVIRLPLRGGTRSFDLSAMMRGAMRGPVTLHVYVWERHTVARTIAQRDVKVDQEWRTATLRFKVPEGYDLFGIFFYLPREDEMQMWLDDIRLTPAGER